MAEKQARFQLLQGNEACVEGAIAAGTRRIEAVVGKSAFEFMNAKVKEIDKLSLMFKVHYDEVTERVQKIQDENRIDKTA